MVAKYSLGLLALAAGKALAADLPAIQMKGSKFFFENGTQFFMKGVAYQQDTAAAGQETDSNKFIDPLADEDRCKVDVPLLAELGTNIIRTYAINPDADHSACMKLLSENGIYVISDLGQPSLSINRDSPAWDTELFARYTDVVDELGQYSNVLGFFAGNEVSNNKTNTEASAYVKAAVRDTKKYIADNSDRWMGVGYAANDDPDIRIDMAQYFNCGEEESAIDFWGYNIYSWCGESSMQKSGYSDQVEFFSNYSVPVFFAEYGCNEPDGADGRIFQETAALYSDEMTEVFSGGIVYMYFQEDNDYGLVTVSGSKATKGADFKYLQKQATAADPKGVELDSYKPDNTASKCPGISEIWKVSGEALPPTPDKTLCECMSKSRTCVQADNLSTKKYSDIFDYICSEAPEVCTAINGNSTIGSYGAYSMCTDSQKLDYALDAYYQSLDSASDACDFDGQAQIQKAQDSSSCKSSLAEADDHNKVVATATSATDSATETGGSGSSDEDAEDFGIPGVSMSRVFSFGDVAVGLYMVVAVGVGAMAVL